MMGQIQVTVGIERANIITDKGLMQSIELPKHKEVRITHKLYKKVHIGRSTLMLIAQNQGLTLNNWNRQKKISPKKRRLQYPTQRRLLRIKHPTHIQTQKNGRQEQDANK